jgi:hypothetical protein
MTSPIDKLPVQAATPGPWQACILDKPIAEIPAYVGQCISTSGGENFYFISATDPQRGGVDIAHVGNGPAGEANARRIVQCVNNFDALVSALKAIVDAADSPTASGGEMWFAEAVYPAIEAARAALNQAQEQK